MYGIKLVQLEFAKESELKELGDGEWQGNVCKDCKSLKEIRLPEGLEKIWDNSFQGCTQLEEVYIPSTVTLLRYGIFSECANISRVEFQAILAGKAMYDNLFRVAFKSKEKEIYFDYAGTLEEWKEFVLYDTHNISKRMWRETDGSSRHDTIYIRCSDGLIYKFTTNDTSTLEETSETLEADWDWTKSYEMD